MIGIADDAVPAPNGRQDTSKRATILFLYVCV